MKKPTRTFYLWYVGGAYIGPSYSLNQVNKLCAKLCESSPLGEPMINIYFKDGKDDYLHLLKTYYRLL